jgi:hypothetical protein
VLPCIINPIETRIPETEIQQIITMFLIEVTREKSMPDTGSVIAHMTITIADEVRAKSTMFELSPPQAKTFEL